MNFILSYLLYTGQTFEALQCPEQPGGGHQIFPLAASAVSNVNTAKEM